MPARQSEHAMRRIALALLAICLAAALPAAAQTPGSSGTGSQLVMLDAEHAGLRRATGRAPAGRSRRRSHRSGEPRHLSAVQRDRRIRRQHRRSAAGGDLGEPDWRSRPISIGSAWPESPGLSTHVIFVNRSGANDSHLFGDNVSPVQEIFGAGGNVAVHLVSAYAEETLFERTGWTSRRLDERGERLRQFATLLQLHEQRLVRRPEGVAGWRYRPQCLPGRSVGGPDSRAPDVGYLRHDRRL